MECFLSRSVRIPPLLMVLVGVACSGPGRSSSGTVVRDSAGIIIVENDHTRPAWSGDDAWHLSPDPFVRIGTVAGDTTQQLYRVTHSKLLPDGRIAVVNSGSAEVRFYDNKGEHLGSIGGSGEGPGEFRSPWVVHPLSSDSLLVVDLYREISVFNNEGLFVRRYLPERPEGSVFGDGLEPVDQFGDGSLLFRSHYREEPGSIGLSRSRIQMVRSLPDGSFGGSFGDFDDQTVMYGGGFYAFGAWAKEAAADTTMWYGPGDRFEFREVGLDQSTIRIVRLDRPARAVTDQDVADYRAFELERAEGTRNEQFVNRMIAEMEFPPTFPAHFEIRTDPLSNLWVQDYQPLGSHLERVWTVFDPDGRYLGDVIFPPGFRVHEIGTGSVSGLWTDELGVEYVHMYKIEKPSG